MICPRSRLRMHFIDSHRSVFSCLHIPRPSIASVFIEEVVHGTHPLHPGTEDLTSFAWILGMGFALQEVWPRVRLTPERAQVENVEASRAEEALEVKENV